MGWEPDEREGAPDDFKEPRSPEQIEATLSFLSDAVAKAEIMMRERLRDELEAKKALEKKHVTAAMSRECPKPSRSAEITVAMRDDWIREQEADELEHWQDEKLRVELMKRYQTRLEDQISIQQSQLKAVALIYQTTSSSRY